jgi:hypothetical protein
MFDISQWLKWAMDQIPLSVPDKESFAANLEEKSNVLAYPYFRINTTDELFRFPISESYGVQYTATNAKGRILTLDKVLGSNSIPPNPTSQDSSNKIKRAEQEIIEMRAYLAVTNPNTTVSITPMSIDFHQRFYLPVNASLYLNSK